MGMGCRSRPALRSPRPTAGILRDGDGCAMYTISATWDHAREHLKHHHDHPKNGAYGILHEEWKLLKEPGQNELHDSPLMTWAERSRLRRTAQAMASPRRVPTRPSSSQSTDTSADRTGPT